MTLLASLGVALLVTSSCSTINDAKPKGDAKSKCATVNLAMNEWVGYTANAAVLTEVAQSRLSCTVKQLTLSEQVSWQGLADGTVDVIIENWGHDDLVKKYITDQKVAIDAGLTGNVGRIGWYVPPWLAKEHPEVLDSKNLNTFQKEFATSESGELGQLLDGDPGFVTNDAALVTNLGLKFKVIYSGSESALIQAFRSAEKNKTWLLAYFYEPQWFIGEVPLQKVTLPAYTEGCDAVPEKVACDYPEYHLNKIMSTKLADSGSPAAKLIKNFSWTNDDQNTVANYISTDKMTAEAAAKKWVADNKATVDGWLK